MTLVAVAGLPRLGLDNSPRVFFARDAERLREQQRFEELFTPGPALRIALRSEALWSEGGLETVAEVEAAAGATPGVRRTAGLWSRHRWLLPAWPPPDPARFRRLALADPLDRAAGWVSADGSTVAVDVQLAPEAEGPATVAAVEAAARRAATDDFEVVLAGLPVIERSMDHSLRTLVRRHVPLLVVASALLLALALRSVVAAAAPLAFVALATSGVLGAMGHLGLSLDMISVVLVPLLAVVSLATALHLQIGVRRELADGASPRAAVDATYRRRGRAVMWTAVTTAVAFGTFVTSPVPPVRGLGLALAAGMAWILILAFGLYPALLRIAARRWQRVAAVDRRLRPWGSALAAFATRRRGAVLAVFGLLTVAALGGALTLRRDSGLLSYFSPRHPARASVELLESAGLAAVTAELVIELSDPAAGSEASFRDPDRLAELAALSERLRSIPGVRGAIGAGDLFRAALDEVVVDGEPSARARWMVLGMMQADPTTSSALDDLLTGDGRAARLRVALPLRGPRSIEPLLSEVRQTAREAFPGDSVLVAGELPLIVATQGRLLRTLALSLLLTVVCVALFLAFISRDRATALAALAANLWPVAAVFGAMAAARVPLDSTTVMIAAVALGLAVDDTLHTLAELRPDPAGGAVGLAETLGRVAPAHVLTAVVLTAGFTVCALSDFLPVARFGALAIVGVAAALAGDLLLLPALLTRRRARGEAPGATLNAR